MAKSWPLAKLTDDGGIIWHVAGTHDPPQYEADERLEQLWREGQARLYRPKGKVIQLELWEKAA